MCSTIEWDYCPICRKMYSEDYYCEHLTEYFNDLIGREPYWEWCERKYNIRCDLKPDEITFLSLIVDEADIDEGYPYLASNRCLDLDMILQKYRRYKRINETGNNSE